MVSCLQGRLWQRGITQNEQPMVGHAESSSIQPSFPFSSIQAASLFAAATPEWVISHTQNYAKPISGLIQSHTMNPGSHTLGPATSEIPIYK